MAALRQKKDGRFFIDYRDESGARFRRIIQKNGIPVLEKAVAEKFYAAWIQANDHPASTTKKPQAPRIASILDYYRDVYLPATNAAPKTFMAAATHCEAFTEWLRGQRIGSCQQLSKSVMMRWSTHLQQTRNARTTSNYLTTIRTAINVAVDAELIDASPIRGRWTLPKVDPVERNPLALEELTALRGEFDSMPIVQWICLTGNRPSDAVSLTFRDVDIETQTVDRTSVKSRALRRYEISAKAVGLVAQEATRKHVNADVVFLNPLGNPWSFNTLRRAFTRRLEDIEYPRHLTLRDLRHSFATAMANDLGVPLPALQILMGHTDIKTTMKYVKATGARSHLDKWDALQGG